MAKKYSQNADKVLSKAIPTVNANGIVLRWDIEVTYSYPATGITTTDTPLRRKYNNNENVLYLNKKPEDFTKKELINLLNIANYDLVFDSTYESVVSPPDENKLNNFDLNLLSD